MERKLTDRQRAFIEHYLQCWNASEAARRAGYNGRSNSVGASLLSNNVIRAEVESRLASFAMGANEVLARLAEHASASLDDFIGESGGVDFERARARGKMHLLKSYSSTDKGVRIEIVDQQSALVHVGKHLRLFADKLEAEQKIVLDDISGLSADERERRIAELLAETNGTPTIT